ncbi:hypothetical protein J2847_004087 [Azospirillum agricola]|uniref:hypothetical protein n=1 Tax=Azospirillum agricola TaxID=1720247 RepID=UPI001AE56D8C|nr:hypothetical protein [Azospirillum agricola]MBP2230778.1 hypothetical protein [Azospirillum agricola]
MTPHTHTPSPIRRDIRWAAERHQPVTLTAEEVASLEEHLEALEEGWEQETHAS